MANEKIVSLLGADAENLLNHQCKTIDKSVLHLPNKNFVDEVWAGSNRNIQTLRSLQAIFNEGRLANTGYIPFCQLIKGLNTQQGHLLLLIQFILILKTLLNWL
ncbi:MAG: hypothetical protein LC127_18320 [Chitinophagales bacterium]|nr:hypothetical protein [Chitinophagales bacterium]